MSKPVVSIIVPAFNAAAYIHETVDSVLKQDFTDWELIIVDDHSTDGTWRILNDYAMADIRIKVHRFDENFGRPAGPRNFGVSHSRAPWVAFLDADDIWHPEKLKRQLDVAGKTGADIVCSTMKDFKGVYTGFPGVAIDEGLQKLGAFSMFSKNRVPTSSVLINRKSFLMLGGFEEAAEYRAVEDYDLWLRAACNNMNIIKMNGILLMYRILPNSISRSKFKQVKRVLRVVYTNLALRKREWCWLFPFFATNYVFQSVYSRLIKGTL